MKATPAPVDHATADDEIEAEKPASTRASDDIMIRGSLLFNA